MQDGDVKGHTPHDQVHHLDAETHTDPAAELRGLERSLTASTDPDAAAHTRLREADASLVAFLRRRNFEGPHYRTFTAELMDYGWRTLSTWTASGHIFERTARMGRPVPPAMMPDSWTYEDRTQVVTDTVIKGSSLFREHGLVRGKRTPDGGASLTTYFVGATILAFRPVYIRWHKNHHVGQSELNHRTADTDDILYAQQDIPDQRATDPAQAAVTHDDITRLRTLLPDEQLREALGWMALGYTQAEAADRVGLTPKALERRLARARNRISASGLHTVQLEEGEHDESSPGQRDADRRRRRVHLPDGRFQPARPSRARSQRPHPDEAQSRLRESAEGPDAEQEPTARTTQEATTTTTDAGDASEDDPLDPCRPGNWQLRTFSWTMNSVLGTPEHHAPALHLRQLLAAGPPATTRTTGIHEWLLREPDNNRHYLLTHTEDPLAPTLLPCTTDPGPTYSSASAFLRMALFRQRLEHVLGARPGPGFPDYRLTRTSAGPSAESLARTSFDIELNTTCNVYTALRLAGEPESRGSFTSRIRIRALMKQAYESALIDYAAHELAGNSQRSDQQVRAPGTADPTRFGAPAPAHSIDRLAAGRLTDLLQPARLQHLEQLHQHPADGRTRCRIATIPDRVPAGAWRPLLLSAISGYPWAHGTTPGGHLITGETALPGLTPQDTTAVTDLPLTPAHLLIATDSAVSLDQAHRHTIPEQAPTPPDLDAYTAQPGSLLLLPAATATAAGHGDSRKTVNRTHDTEDPDKELTSENSSSDPSELLTDDRRTTKLWTTRTDDGGDGLEQRMQLWMRQHHTEDDRGDRILTELAYRTKDPYAVTAVFYAGTEEELEWTFARELLTDGLHTSVGIGDVIIWPGPQRPGDTQRIFIRLRPPGSTALLSLDHDDALEFLETTQPLPQNPSATARTAVLATWEQELRDLICPSPGE